MIVAVASGKGGMSVYQIAALRRAFDRLPIDALIHRGVGNDVFAHDSFRHRHPLAPIHVLAPDDEHSMIASIDLPKFPQTIIYQRDTRERINAVIVETIHGLICAEPDDLYRAACNAGVPIIRIGSYGKLSLERNEL
jgi:hypothetical protein